MVDVGTQEAIAIHLCALMQSLNSKQLHAFVATLLSPRPHCNTLDHMVSPTPVPCSNDLSPSCCGCGERSPSLPVCLDAVSSTDIPAGLFCVMCIDTFLWLRESK